MKASADAVATTSTFLGQDVAGSAEKLHSRRAIDALHVPQNDDGLRLLAANGDWASVVALADKLEDEAAARSKPHAAKKDGARFSAHTAALAARLPYVLVQVTAYFKMQRAGAAKKLIDTLGDLEGDGFLYPGTDESFAPFSLRFLAVLMPYYLGVPMEAQRRLYGLLDECVQRRVRHATAAAAASPGSAAHEEEETALWLHREARVRRALIYLHYTAGQYAVSIQHFNKLLAAMDAGSRSATRTETVTAAVSGGAVALTTDQRVRRVLVLQQMACLCLHCGGLVLAQQAFQQMEHISSSKDTQSAAVPSGKEKAALDHVNRMNGAFLLAFYGRFTEAAATFRDIAASAKVCIEESEKQHHHQGQEELESGSGATTELLDAVLVQVRANAQTSEAACMPYCQAGTDPHTAIANLITHAEAHLRQNPNVLSSSDAFIADLVRLYTLAGDRKEKLEQLASVLEVFRCDAASLPNLEKLV